MVTPSTPGPPLFSLTFFHASQTSHFEISNGLPGDFSSLTRLLPQPEGLVDRTNTATDDLAPWLHLHRTKQRLHSYYRPVRQRVPRRYSIPRRVSTWESPSRHVKKQQFRDALSHVPRKSSRSGSRRLYARPRLASKRAPARLIPGPDTK